MDLKNTLEKDVTQLKNSERTLENVAIVSEKIIVELYENVSLINRWNRFKRNFDRNSMTVLTR